jgi:cytoskeletal protein RodZ
VIRQLPELGKWLKAIREEKGMSLEDAGDQLNIKCEDLNALEEEDFLSFPDRQFAWTVLEIYATFLGMNKEEVNREFSEIWSEYGPLGRLFKKRGRKRTKEILATETADIPILLEQEEYPEEPEQPVELTPADEPIEIETPEDVPEELPEEIGEPVPYLAVSRETVLPEEVVFVEAAAAKEEPSSKKKFPVAAVAAILVIAVGAFAVWQSQSSTKPGQVAEGTNQPSQQVSGDSEKPKPAETPKPEKPVEKETPKGEIAPSLEPDEVTTQAVNEQSITIEITTPNGECWVEVVADGEQVYYRLVPSDTKPLKFKADDEMSVLIGDAAAARIKCNGKDLGVLGSRTVVVQKVFTAEEE